MSGVAPPLFSETPASTEDSGAPASEHTGNKVRFWGLPAITAGSLSAAFLGECNSGKAEDQGMALRQSRPCPGRLALQNVAPAEV